MDKQEIFKKVEIVLRELLGEAEKLKKESQEESSQHIGAMESRYDTFKEEAQYAVATQERKINELSQAITEIQKIINDPEFSKVNRVIELGAIFTLKSADKKSKFLLLPVAAGVKLKDGDDEILVITQNSLIGKSTLGKKIGDQIENKYEIIDLY